MKKYKNSITANFFVSFIIIFTFIIVFLYIFQFLPVYNKLANSSLNEKLNLIVNLYQNPLGKSIENADDITMVNAIDNIMKFDGVYTAFVIDKSGKVLTHDRTAEWGKTYSDKFSKNAASAAGKRVQSTGKANEYLFSCPVTSSATLCVGITKEKIEKNLEVTKREYIYTSLILFTVSLVAVFLLINLLLLRRLKKLGQILKSISLSKSGFISDSKNDEIGRLSEQINSALSSIEPSSKYASTILGTEKKDFLLFKEIAAYVNSGFMVISSENKVISINGKFSEFLSLDEGNILGKHLLDTVKIPQILNLVKKSLEKPNIVLKETVQNKTINVKTILTDENEPAGTILSLD